MPRWIGHLCLLLAAVSAARSADAQPTHALSDGQALASGSDGSTTTHLSDGRVVRVGGRHLGTPVSTVLIQDGAGNVIATARLLIPRSEHTATALPDGTVLIAGGWGPDGQPVPVAETFDPATGVTTPVAGALTPRADHTATMLPTGRVLFLGGRSGPELTSAIELWDPETQTSLALGTAWDAPRAGHTAELQGDGSVIITGGTPSTRARFVPALGSVVPVSDGLEIRADDPVALTLTAPAHGAAEVPTTATLLLAFSGPVRVGDALAVRLASADGTVIPAAVVRMEAGRLWSVVPSEALTEGTVYHLSVSGFRDAQDRTVPPASIAFRTTSAPSAPLAPAGDDETWHPAPGRWSTGRPPSPWESLPPLRAPDGVTALAGRVLLLNGRPLAGVAVSFGGQHGETDRTGRFLIGDIPGGPGTLTIDGRPASTPGRQFGVFHARVTAHAATTTPLDFTIWMPRIDTAHAIRVPNPISGPTVVTTPLIPGLEVHLPAGVAVKDHEGRVADAVSITPIPVDRPPFPLPAGVDVPVYFTIQPGGGYLTGGDGAWPPGAQIVYPNYEHDLPGARMNFWNYDPDARGWHVYGLGTVSASGEQVVPDPTTRIYAFTGAMFNNGQSPPPEGPTGRTAGDPVDLATGLFVYQKTDLALSDVIPLALTRTYRTRDLSKRPFGIGTSHAYGLFLWSANPYQEVDLVLPDGSRVHYTRISAGTGFLDAVLENTTHPGAFYKSRIAWNGNGWDLTLRDGTVYVFGNEAPLQAIRDRFGNSVTISWSTTNPFGSGTGNITRVHSTNGRWIAFSYDGDDRIIEARDNLNRVVTYTYDTSGRLWKVTDAANGMTEYTYDAAHRMGTIKDPRGIVFLTNEYDASGRVSKQTQADTTTYLFAYTTDGSGRIVQTDVTNPRGVVERSVFNAAGYEVSCTEAVGTSLERTTTYVRNATHHRIERVTDPLGRHTDVTYTSTGQVASITRLAGTANAVTTSATYEPVFHQLATLTDPLNHTTTFTYDGNARLSGMTDALSRQWSVALNAAGQPVSITTPLTHATQLEYAFGDLAAVLNGLGKRVTFHSDVGGRRVSVTDPLGHRTQITYTPLNLIASISDAKGGVTSVTYDGNGNLLTLTDPRSGVTTYTYDDMDRVATRTDPVGQAEGYLYDANGNLREVTDRKSQTTTFTYDALDRLATVTYHDSSTATYTYDAGDRLTQIADSAAGTVTRTYDDLDRLTTETTTEGTVSYTYDAAGRRTSMTASGQTAVTYGYDDADQLTSVTQGTTTVALAYDLAGRRSSLVLPNGITTTYSHDAADQLTSLTWATSVGTLGDLTYTYDDAGRRMRLGGSFARTSIPSPLGLASYDLANRIQSWDGTAFTYDLNGNLTSDGTTTYTWNVRDQLMTASGPNPGSFTYDAVGRRRTRAVGGVTTSYVYDGLDAVQEQIGGSTSANYLLGLGIDERFARTDGTGTSWYVPDALQSTLALADGTGAIQTAYTYEPYGTTTQSGTASANPARYTGRDEDGTGLYYYRARYYDPRRQRFASEDQLGFGGGDLNLYAYVGDAPIDFSDPSGNIGPGAALLIGCALGAGATAAGDMMAGRKINWSLAAAGCLAGGLGGFYGAGGAAAAAAAAAPGGAVGAGAAAATVAAAAGQHAPRVKDATTRAVERQLAEHGAKALEKSLRTLEKRLLEHLEKLAEAKRTGGYTSSIEREIRQFERLIEVIKRALRGR